MFKRYNQIVKKYSYIQNTKGKDYEKINNIIYYIWILMIVIIMNK